MRCVAPVYQDVAWHVVDIGEPAAVAALTGTFRGAGAVVHLAWQIQPSHDRHQLRRTNVDGTAHVAEVADRVDAVAALADLLAGMARRSGLPVAPLRPRPGATDRATALLSGRLPGHGNPY